jgi:hypothetical protein
MAYTFDAAAAHESYLARLPEDGRARLLAPGAEFKLPQGFTYPVCYLKANDPVSTPGRFLRLEPVLSMPHQHDPSSGQINWINMAATNRSTGGGIGFPDITERPRIKAQYPAPPQLRQIWPLAQFFVASRAVCELFREYDANAIETVEIDWKFSNGSRLDGYAFLDIRSNRYSCDFFRSDIQITDIDGLRYMKQQGHRTLRTDIPEEAHFFRESLDWSEILVSREFAIALETRAPGECQFWDIQAGQEIPMALERIRKQRSIFKRHDVAASQLHDMHRALESDVRPQVLAGDFIAAEKALLGLLRSTDPSPYHVVCDLEITNSGKSIARYLTDFAKLARSQGQLSAIYCEMNDFTVNTGTWLFDAVGLAEIGGRDDLDWLDGYAYSNESQVITGLEPLQNVFADSRVDRERGFEQARILCEALVVVKFQKMLHEARPLKKGDVPLFANAHDFGEEYLAEMPQPPGRRGWFA